MAVLEKARAQVRGHGHMQIHAGKLTHTSQEAKAAMDDVLKRAFTKMRSATLQTIGKQIQKAHLNAVLLKADVSTVEEFRVATKGKTRYSVNHVFDQNIQRRPGGKKPYGKKAQIFQEDVDLKLLVPTQYWVFPEQVIHYVDYPSDRPVDIVLSGDGDYLLSDGHHRAVAAMLTGEDSIKGQIFPRWASREEIERNKAKKVLGWQEGLLAKEDDYSDITDAIMEGLSDELATIPDEVKPYLEQAALSGLTQGVLAVDVSDTGLLSDVNATARDWAADRAAELVGMKWSDTADALVANPNAKWAITDATRNKIQEVVTEAFTEKSDLTEIAMMIDDAGIFSPARSEMIAQTEVSRAQIFGNFQLWLQSGVVKTVDWVPASEDTCEICQDFADGGPYEIDSAPLPVDDSHPNCHCILSAAEVSTNEEE